MNPRALSRSLGHLRPLLWKEWRDVRTASIVVVASTPVAALIAAWLDVYAKSDFAPELVFAAVVPSVLGLWLGLVASDLFSRDTSTRRIEALGLLPTHLGTVWTSKILFLATGIVVLGVWGVLQLHVGSWLFGFPRGLGETARLALGAPVAQSALILLTGLLIFASTTGLRGFASVGVAAVGIGLSVYAGLVWPWADWGLPPDGVVSLVVAVLITAGLVLASAVGFVRGRAHRGRRAVVASLAAATLACVVVPTGVAAATAVQSRMELPHGDPETRLERLETTPDGRFVVVQLRRAGTSVTQRVRAFGIDDGAWAETTSVGHRLSRVHAPDLIEVQRLRHTPTGERLVVETSVVSPDGASAVLDADESHVAAPHVHRIGDGLWHVSFSREDRWAYERVRSRARPLSLPGPALLHVAHTGELVRLELMDETRRSLPELDLEVLPETGDVSPDGSHIVLRSREATLVHRTDDLVGIAEIPGSGWSWADDDALVRAVDDRWELWRLTDGISVDLGLRPAAPHRLHDFVDVLPDGGIVVTRPDDVLWLLDRDGAPIRELVRLRGE